MAPDLTPRGQPLNPAEASLQIEERKEETIRKWIHRVRLSIPSLQEPLDEMHLIDSLPIALSQLSSFIRNPRSEMNYLENLGDLGRMHATMRSALPGFTSDELSLEYKVLGEVVLETLEATRPLDQETQELVQMGTLELRQSALREFEKVQRLQTHTLPPSIFATLFRDLPGFFVVLSPGFTILTASQEFLEGSHTRSEDIIGRNLFDVFPDDPNNPARGKQHLQESLERVIATKKRDSMAVQRYSIRTDDGTFQVRYWSAVNNPVLGEDGEVAYIIHRTQDVTPAFAERPGEDMGAEEQELYRSSHAAQSEKRLAEEASRQLERERELREQFISTLSHDLRNPLSAAKISAQIIARDPANLNQTARLIDRILTSLERADRMIQDLLDISRVRAGTGLEIKRRRSDLVTLLEDIQEEFATVHGNRFEISVPDSASGLWDAQGVRRAIENLLTNAVKYGSPESPIRLELTCEKAICEIRVNNQGKPIPPEDLSRLFEPFVRSQSAESGATRGWGLGLALVKAVAVAHGGKVSVTSDTQAGTTFTMILPVRTDERS